MVKTRLGNAHVFGGLSTMVLLSFCGTLWGSSLNSSPLSADWNRSAKGGLVCTINFSTYTCLQCINNKACINPTEGIGDQDHYECITYSGSMFAPECTLNPPGNCFSNLEWHFSDVNCQFILGLNNACAREPNTYTINQFMGDCP